MYHYEDFFGILRTDSVPIDDQVIELFKLGLTYDQILHGLGLSSQDLEFDAYLEMIGVPKEEYWKRRVYNQSERRRRERNQTGWQSNRRRAFERDGGMCVICGKKVGLAVHHIDPFSESNDSEIDNLITLCRSHHAQAHRQRTRALLRRRLTSIAARRDKACVAASRNDQGGRIAILPPGRPETKSRAEMIKSIWRSAYYDNKNAALRRDGHKCVVCGSSVGLNVHPIEPFLTNQDSILDNLITLCQMHHHAVHGRITSFLFNEYCRLAGESTQKPYTRKNLEEVRRRLSMKGINTRKSLVWTRARKRARSYLYGYEKYIDSQFPGKLRRISTAQKGFRI